MANYEGCEVKEREDGGIEFRDVSLPEGEIIQLLITPGGVCAIIPSDGDPQALYQALRGLLGTTVVSLYVYGKGRFDPFEGSVTPIPGGWEQISVEVAKQQRSEPPCYSSERLRRMQDSIVKADAYCRGFYREADGTLYLLRNGYFRRASEIDPERQFLLTAYGGFLGLHRFAVGKYASGLLYLCTCGFFLTGWLLDLLQMFIGVQRDKHKDLILPLQNKRKKLLKVVPALALGLLVLFLYLQLFSGFADTAGTSAQSGAAERIANTFLRYFPQLSDFTEY